MSSINGGFFHHDVIAVVTRSPEKSYINENHCQAHDNTQK